MRERCLIWPGWSPSDTDSRTRPVIGIEIVMNCACSVSSAEGAVHGASASCRVLERLEPTSHFERGLEVLQAAVWARRRIVSPALISSTSAENVTHYIHRSPWPA